MNYNLNERVKSEIIELAKKHNLDKIILFGSRARGDNHERSDIDLAVTGGDILNFSFDVDEEVWTLLNFDVIDLDRGISADLQAEIDRDGVIIYEKVWIFLKGTA